ncbi:MAG: TolC family protein [Candidatus Latescibacterota bacterium]|jgi:outer membrane protein TolC
MKTLVISLATVLAAVRPAPAQEVVTLGLAEARQRARTLSAQVRVGIEVQAAAAARQREAGAARLPRLELSGRYARLSRTPDPSVTVPAMGTLTIGETVVDQQRLAAAVVAPLFTGFQLENGQRAAARAATAAEQQVNAVREERALAAERAYWGLYQARVARQTIAESVRLVEAHRADADRLQAAGLLIPDEVLEVEVRLSEARLRLVEAEHRAELAEAALALAVSLPLQVRLALSDTPTVVIAPLPPLAELQARARAARPELLGLRELLTGARLQAAVARGERLPAAQVRAEYETANPNSRFFPPENRWRDSWSVGLGVTWTAWDWGLVSERVRRAEAEARQVEEREREASEGVDLELLRYRLDAEAAVRRLEVAEVGVRQAALRAGILRARFAAGTVTGTQVLDAEVALERARLERVGALVDQRLAWAGLERAVGGGLR